MKTGCPICSKPLDEPGDAYCSQYHKPLPTTPPNNSPVPTPRTDVEQIDYLREEIHRLKRELIEAKSQLTALQQDAQRLVSALKSAFEYAQVGSYRGPSNEAWVSMKIEVEQIIDAAMKESK